MESSCSEVCFVMINEWWGDSSMISPMQEPIACVSVFGVKAVCVCSVFFADDIATSVYQKSKGITYNSGLRLTAPAGLHDEAQPKALVRLLDCLHERIGERLWIVDHEAAKANVDGWVACVDTMGM